MNMKKIPKLDIKECPYCGKITAPDELGCQEDACRAAARRARRRPPTAATPSAKPTRTTKKSTTPRILRVDIIPMPDNDPGTPSRWANPGFSVIPVWADVDRPVTYSMAVKDMKMANRLKAAIEAGVVFRDCQIKADVNGQTYVSNWCNVMGKYLNADLLKLGF